MGEINSFPIQTKAIYDLEVLSAANSQPNDPLMIYDESVGVWKVIPLGDVAAQSTTLLDSVADLALIDGSILNNHQPFQLKSFSPSGSSGGGFLVWDSAIPKLKHDGQTYFSPSVPAPTDFNDATQVANYKAGIGEMYPTGDGVLVLTKTAYETVYVNTYDDLASTPIEIGQVVYLKQHTSGGIGGGSFIGVSSVALTANNGTISPTGTAGVYAKRINYDSISPDDFGALGGASDDTVAVQDAFDYCNSFSPATKISLLRLYTITSSIYIDRATDTTTGWFVVDGCLNRGGINANSGITMFSSRLPYTVSPPYGNNPCSERIIFINVQFQANADYSGTVALDDKFLRILFVRCQFLRSRVIKNVSTGYLQTITMLHCKHNLQNTTQNAIDSVDGYDIRVNGAQFENTGPGFRFSGLVRGCQYDGGLYQGSTGPYVSMSGAIGFSISKNYFESNSVKEIILGDAGGVSSGGIIDSNQWLLHDPQASDANYYPISVGQIRHLTLSNNSCNGNLLDNTGAAPFSVTQYGNEVPADRRVTKVSTLTDISITANPAGTQAAAYVLKTKINIVTVAVAGASVRLPLTGDCQDVDTILIKNLTAVSINVYPGVGQRIRGLVVNAASPLAAGATMTFVNSISAVTYPTDNYWDYI